MGKPVIILAVAVVLLLVGLGVYMKASAPFEVDVITKHNEYCKVHEGDSRSEVRKRCGNPCREGVSIRGGRCDGDSCKACDMYGVTAVCYLNDVAVSTEQHTNHGCTWF
ncbi:MAG: hypothetical protein AB7S68_34010 [Polyangiaceae bacterium]